MTSNPGGGRSGPGWRPPTNEAQPTPRLAEGDRLSRYRIVSQLGAGGLGGVYLAEDVDNGRRVALKTLHDLDADGRYALKTEFRTVADLVHPNLVTVYELEEVRDLLFFTMEYVDGVPFTDWAAGKEFSDLRSATAQLVGGVNALHRAGLVHRDLKPNNVLVEPGGRVVVLDYGFVAPDPLGDKQPTGSMMGTPTWMSPEQAEGLPAGRPADLYAVGAMLFAALTGRPPFVGPSWWVMGRKKTKKAPLPSQLREDTPADLDGLCRDLLHRNPRRRPQGHEVLGRLGGPAGLAAEDKPVGTRFIGREAPLRALDTAWERSLGGEPVVVLLRGAPGIGKSTLVDRFVRSVSEAGGDPAILLGRCHEHDSVPFKGFDTVADSLSQLLLSTRSDAATDLPPDHARALLRLLPVLGRAPGLRKVRLAPIADADPGALRRRAVSALKTVLGRVAESRPLLLVLDDLHWADHDSLRLLADLLSPPSPPPMLLLTALRPIEAARVGVPGRLGVVDVGRVELEIGALHGAEALALALDRVSGPGALRAEAEEVVRESGGVPLLIEMLSDRRRGAGTLQEMVDGRLAALSADERRVAELVAVAGTPVRQELVLQAAGVEAAEQQIWRVLRAEKFARTSGPGDGGVAEPWHDRIRETVTAGLAEQELVERHLALADTLEKAGGAEPSRLAVHLRGAGQPRRAFPYFLSAAEQAKRSFAFDVAANSYRDGLACASEVGLDAAQPREGLAGVLAAAGMLGEAAPAFLEAAECATPERAAPLQCRAAEAYMVSGRVEEGWRTLRSALAMAGQRLSRFPALTWMWVTTRLLIRGTRFLPRSEAEVPAAALHTIDLLRSAAKGLSIVDEVHSAPIWIKSVDRAIRLGERRRATEALCSLGMMLGSFLPRRADRFLSQAEGLLEPDEPHLQGLLGVCRGVTLFNRGETRAAVEVIDPAVGLLRARCSDVTWECSIGDVIGASARMKLGDLARLGSDAAEWERRAAERQDFYAAAAASLFAGHACLAEDRLDEARRRTLEAQRQLGPDLLNQQWWLALALELRCELYDRRPADAWDRLERSKKQLARSYVTNLRETRIRVLSLRASILAALAVHGPDREPIQRRALRAARKLARQGWPEARGHAQVVRAAVATQRGDEVGAKKGLRSAVDLLGSADRRLDVACARLRLGRLVGGDEGRATVDEARRALLDGGVARPDRWADIYAPGFPSGDRTY